MRRLARATDHRPLAFEARKLNNPGESRIGHFNDAADKADNDTPVHNGMNEDRDIPRFGADEYDY